MPALIRMATERDAERIRAIYAPIVEETSISFELVTPSVEELRGKIAETLERFPWLVCENDGTIRGYAYAGPHRHRAAYQWSAEVSVYVDDGSRRLGVGRALYTSLLELLRAQGFYNVYAGITLPNQASVGLHESLGFEPVGVYGSVGYKQGRWHDVGWWQLGLRTHDGDPVPPVGIEDIRGSEAWEEALAKGTRRLLRGR